VIPASVIPVQHSCVAPVCQQAGSCTVAILLSCGLQPAGYKRKNYIY